MSCVGQGAPYVLGTVVALRVMAANARRAGRGTTSDGSRTADDGDGGGLEPARVVEPVDALTS